MKQTNGWWLPVAGATATAGTTVLSFLQNINGLPLWPPFLWVLALTIAIVSFRPAFERLRTSRYPSPSTTSSAFQPFQSSSASHLVIWSRHDDLERLKQKIARHARKHIILSGHSGAGKSTLLTRMLPQAVEGWRFLPLNTYEAPFSDICSALGGQLPAQFLVEVWQNFPSDLSIAKVLGDQPDPLVVQLRNRIETLVASVETPTIIVLDQFERAITRFEECLDNNSFGYELVAFILFLEQARRKEKLRTIFSIRADRYFSMLSMFEMVTRPERQSDERAISYMLLSGIDQYSSPEATSEIYASLRTIDGAGGYWQQMVEALGLQRRGRSNTFVTQLYGFVVGGYYRHDAQVRRMVERGHPPVEAIDVFLRVLENDFRRETRGDVPSAFLRAVLRCICYQGLSQGTSIAPADIAAIIHLPQPIVETIVDFLYNSAILTKETADRKESYRVVHEVLGERVLASNDFAIDPLWNVSIEGIIDQHTSTEKLTLVERLPSLRADLLPPRSLTAIGAILIWLVLLHGVVTINWDAACEVSKLSFDRLPDWLGPVTDCADYKLQRLAVLTSHMLWLWYIYQVTEGFLLRVSRGIERFFVSAMPSIGALLSIALAHHIQLLVVPIGAVGLMLAFVLLFGEVTRTYKGVVADTNRSWGIRTFGNMLFVLSSTLLMILLVSRTSYPWPWAAPVRAPQSLNDYWVNFASWSLASVGLVTLASIFLSALMSYFWWHIYPGQQSADSIAARLSQFDRAKTARAE